MSLVLLIATTEARIAFLDAQRLDYFRVACTQQQERQTLQKALGRGRSWEPDSKTVVQAEDTCMISREKINDGSGHSW